MKACAIRKTNLRSEFTSALVIQKINNCLLAIDLADNWHCWVIPRLPGRVFQKKAIILQPAKTCKHCQDECWLCVPLTVAACLSAQISSPKAARTSGWLAFEVRCTFSLKGYALSLPAAACFGNICLKVNLRP